MSEQPTTPPVDEARTLGGKYLTFRLAGEEYGLQILKVREIIGLLPITQVPRMPEYVLGVINLRGRVIPVVDLRTKFGMSTVEHTRETCIIVLEILRGDTPVTLGVVVDEVAEVRDIPADAVDPAPAFGGSVDTGYLIGIGKLADRVAILLDIDRALSTEAGSISAQVARLQDAA